MALMALGCRRPRDCAGGRYNTAASPLARNANECHRLWRCRLPSLFRPPLPLPLLVAAQPPTREQHHIRFRTSAAGKAARKAELYWRLLDDPDCSSGHAPTHRSSVALRMSRLTAPTAKPLALLVFASIAAVAQIVQGRAVPPSYPPVNPSSVTLYPDQIPDDGNDVACIVSTTGIAHPIDVSSMQAAWCYTYSLMGNTSDDTAELYYANGFLASDPGGGSYTDCLSQVNATLQNFQTMWADYGWANATLLQAQYLCCNEDTCNELRYFNRAVALRSDYLAMLTAVLGAYLLSMLAA